MNPWLRLDKRMLLVHPVTEVVKYVPVLIGSVILGASSGNHLWSLIPTGIVVGLALTRWFTTTYRVGPTHVELRTGLLQRRSLSVPRSRIRSVDIEADLLHRALGLAVLAIGTGQQAEAGERFKLDALDARLVPGLRAELLDDPVAAARDAVVEEPSGREIGHWRAGWVRYAPLSLTGFAIVAPVVGFGFQYGFGERVFRSAVRGVGGGNPVLGVTGLVLLVVLVISVAACAQYLATYYGLRVLDDGRTLHLRHGFFTTRQITLDLARFRGATVKEPLLLRVAGAAQLEAIMTGENPRQRILPQAPGARVHHTLAHLLTPAARRVGAHAPVLVPGEPDDFAEGDALAAEAPPRTRSVGLDVPTRTDLPGSGIELPGTAPEAAEAPGSVELISHGRAARYRRYTHAVNPTAATALVPLLASLAGVRYSPWWWLAPALLTLAAVALAEDRYRGLGHAVLPATPLAPTWLVTRSGSLDRDRDCLAAPGVLGWTVRQTFFQRRAGLATLVAATGAGKKRYQVLDVPVARAYEIIEQVTPGLAGTR
ncbi:PH domain-containing protein [Nocardia asteroides]|uniref:PH domain-containing protein n=1 Tax=Nocardia asteroides TaxID=1824 RepID=UPI001E310C55|nr:PH domain-containing protein [Nocardia asteroides]UGT64253.1 PH domain-containing protein [Nocardia asteroides]